MHGSLLQRAPRLWAWFQGRATALRNLNCTYWGGKLLSHPEGRTIKQESWMSEAGKNPTHLRTGSAHAAGLCAQFSYSQQHLLVRVMSCYLLGYFLRFVLSDIFTHRARGMFRLFTKSPQACIASKRHIKWLRAFSDFSQHWSVRLFRRNKSSVVRTRWFMLRKCILATVLNSGPLSKRVDSIVFRQNDAP